MVGMLIGRHTYLVFLLCSTADELFVLSILDEFFLLSEKIRKNGHNIFYPMNVKEPVKIFYIFWVCDLNYDFETNIQNFLPQNINCMKNYIAWLYCTEKKSRKNGKKFYMVCVLCGKFYLPSIFKFSDEWKIFPFFLFFG